MVTEAVYWDGSAVLSLLFPGQQTPAAKIFAARNAEHVMSSLTLTEVYAAFERGRKSGAYSEAVIAEGKGRFECGRWRYVRVSPHRAMLRELAAACALKGAGLWHLALAKTLCLERPELRLLSFDAKLVEAARGAGISAI